MTKDAKQVVTSVEVSKARLVLDAIEHAATEGDMELVSQLADYLHEEMEGLAMIVKS